MEDCCLHGAKVRLPLLRAFSRFSDGSDYTSSHCSKKNMWFCRKFSTLNENIFDGSEKFALEAPTPARRHFRRAFHDDVTKRREHFQVHREKHAEKPYQMLLINRTDGGSIQNAFCSSLIYSAMFILQNFHHGYLTSTPRGNLIGRRKGLTSSCVDTARLQVLKVSRWNFKSFLRITWNSMLQVEINPMFQATETVLFSVIKGIMFAIKS